MGLDTVQEKVIITSCGDSEEDEILNYLEQEDPTKLIQEDEVHTEDEQQVVEEKIGLSKYIGPGGNVYLESGGQFYMRRKRSKYKVFWQCVGQVCN